MTWTTFVRAEAESQIRRILRDDEILFARSWNDLESLVRQNPRTRVLADPLADGSTNSGAILRLMREFPVTPIVTCVAWSPKGFESGAELARYGVRPAILELNETLVDLADRWSAGTLARGFLGWAERSLSLFPPTLRLAMIDLFERPRRYSTGADLALAAGVSLAAVYRSFEEAQLGTPKRVVVVARITHAYHYLRNSTLQVAAINSLVGFGRPRALAGYTKLIFSCLPSRLRTHTNAQEIMHGLLDWLYKPCENPRQRAFDSVEPS